MKDPLLMLMNNFSNIDVDISWPTNKFPDVSKTICPVIFSHTTLKQLQPYQVVQDVPIAVPYIDLKGEQYDLAPVILFNT